MGQAQAGGWRLNRSSRRFFAAKEEGKACRVFPVVHDAVMFFKNEQLAGVSTQGNRIGQEVLDAQAGIGGGVRIALPMEI